MSATVSSVKAKTGISYAVTDGGATDIVEKYQAILSEPLGPGELITSFSGVPAIGTVHPDRPGYYASKYEISQPDGPASKTLDITVRYSAQSWEVFTPEQGQGISNNVEQWGWDDSTASRELVTDANNVQVLNSAGDPFDTVPTYETPAPVFTKVIRFAARQMGYFEHNCKVNAASLTIGGITFPAHTLLCTIAETIDISNENWPYKYTIRLRAQFHSAKIEGETTAEECGWDVVVCDTGMREVDDATGRLKLIQVPSLETGNPATVTTPELLDGHGHAVVRSAEALPTPYNLRYAPYAETTFPTWFYSEPTLTPSTSNSNS